MLNADAIPFWKPNGGICCEHRFWWSIGYWLLAGDISITAFYMTLQIVADPGLSQNGNTDCIHHCTDGETNGHTEVSKACSGIVSCHRFLGFHAFRNCCENIDKLKCENRERGKLDVFWYTEFIRIKLQWNTGLRVSVWQAPHYSWKRAVLSKTKISHNIYVWIQQNFKNQWCIQNFKSWAWVLKKWGLCYKMRCWRFGQLPLCLIWDKPILKYGGIWL